MLVLSRRRDETIMIDDHIEITIVDIKGDTVRLGIQAPKSVSVHRKEIYEAIQAENIAAARHPMVPDAAAVGGLSALLKQPLATAMRAAAAGRGARPPGAPATGGGGGLSGLSAGLAAGTVARPVGGAAGPAEAQPTPGAAPGAAPVEAKSLAAMFKRKS